jgi:hypothetical protein
LRHDPDGYLPDSYPSDDCPSDDCPSEYCHPDNDAGHDLTAPNRTINCKEAS